MILFCVYYLQTSDVPWLRGLKHKDQALYLHQITAWLHIHVVMAILKVCYGYAKGLLWLY